MSAFAINNRSLPSAVIMGADSLMKELSGATVLLQAQTDAGMNENDVKEMMARSFDGFHGFWWVPDGCGGEGGESKIQAGILRGRPGGPRVVFFRGRGDAVQKIIQLASSIKICQGL